MMERENLEFIYFERKLKAKIRHRMFGFYKFYCDKCSKITQDATFLLNGKPTTVCNICSFPRKSFTERMQ